MIVTRMVFRYSWGKFSLSETMLKFTHWGISGRNFMGI